MPYGSFPEGSDIDTLAAIYAFGLGDDPAADNIFTMPDGIRSFAGNGGSVTDSWNDGFFETPHVFGGSARDTNNYSALWLDTNNPGARIFESYTINDPNWNGAFPTPSIITWITQNIGLGNNPANTAQRSDDVFLAKELWTSSGLRNFVFPDPGTLGLTGMTRATQLFNSSLGPRIVSQENPFGQQEFICFRLQTGATTQFLTHWNQDISNSVAGDGPAWWVESRGHIEDFEPKAGLQAFQTTGVVSDPWGWNVWAWDGATNQKVLTVTPTSGTLNGNTIATLPVASGVSVGVFETPLLDFTTVADNISFTIPLINSGKFFIPFRMNIEFVTMTGVAAGSLIFSIGNGNDTAGNGHANVVSRALGTVSAAGLNATTAFVPIIGIQTNAGVGGTLVDGATEIVVRVVQAPTGMTACTAKIDILGYWRSP
jgi:hypothetical protein